MVGVSRAMGEMLRISTTTNVCSDYKSPNFTSKLYGFWFTKAMGYWVLQRYGLLTGILCIPTW